MVTYYEGNDIYILHLSSGKSIELTTYELEEINSKNQIILKLEESIKDLKESNNIMLKDIEGQAKYIRDCEKLAIQLEESIKDIKDKKVKDNILDTIKELKSNIDNLDFLSYYL